MNSGEKLKDNKIDTKDFFERDEIEVPDIINSLYRNKSLAFIITISSFFLSSIYAFTKTPTWEGQFKIVIAKEKSGDLSNLAANLNLPSFINIPNSPTRKKATEIEILKSPSVLMPIFDKLKKIKKASGKNIDNKRFSKWLKDSVSINLSKGTSVLNISYQDTDKDLIIPILNDISDTYQNYSLSEKKESLKSGIEFSNKKIKELKKKSLQNLKKSEEYASFYNLNPYNFQRKGFDKSFENTNLAFGDLSTEIIRKDANRIINDSKITLKQLNNLDSSDRSFLYISKFVPELGLSKISKDIQVINSKLALARSKLTDNSMEVKSLLIQQENLNELFYKYAQNYLVANINRYELIEKSSERPLEVLLNYSELLRNARGTASKLAQLEQEKFFLELEISKESKPWTLITNPTLKGDPISPNKIKIIFAGTIVGLFFSIFGSLFIDKRKDIIYKIDTVKNLLNAERIFELKYKDKNDWNELVSLFIKGIINIDKFNSVALIPIGKVKNIEDLFILFKKHISSRKLIKTENLLESGECDIQIAILSLDEAERKSIMRFKNKINLQGKNIDYVIVLNNY